jgi:response regulator NasT
VVAEAGAGTELVRAALRSEADIVVFEPDLPHLGGEKAIREIRRIRRIGAVALLSHGTAEMRKQALRENQVFCLEKPIALSEVDQAIQSERVRLNLERQAAPAKEVVERSREDRVLIRQAKQALMRRYLITEAEAHRRMQQTSMNRRMPMVRLAKELLSQPPDLRTAPKSLQLAGSGAR